MSSRPEHAHRHAGFSYIEVLVATALVAATLVPAIDALRTGLAGAAVHADLAALHYRVAGRMEHVLAEPFGRLLEAAEKAGDNKTLSTYSDSAGTPDRLLVYLSYYDAADSDGDGNPFTILDADSDADGNPYTGNDVEIGLLWVQVVAEGTAESLESLRGI